jgi:hypothetical protein
MAAQALMLVEDSAAIQVEIQNELEARDKRCPQLAGGTDHKEQSLEITEYNRGQIPDHRPYPKRQE